MLAAKHPNWTPGLSAAIWSKLWRLDEPVDLFQRRKLDGLETVPWPAPVDHLGL